VRHVRILGLCLAAVFAVAALAAASASAGGPEWGQCYAKAGGKYADSNCTVKAKKGKGEYEWRKGTEVANKEFTGQASTGTLNATYIICGPNDERVPGPCANPEEETKFGPIQVECVGKGELPAERDHGSTTKNGVVNVSVIFRGCAVFGTIPCQNGEEGEIVVNPLKGSLGYINKASKEVGLLLQPALKKGEFAKFNCNIGLTTVVGMGNSKEGTAYPGKGGNDGIISPIGPVDQMTHAFTQTYTVNAEEENIPSKFEGKPIDLLESYLYNTGEPQFSSKWSKAGETVTAVNVPAEEEGGEIKA